MSSFTNPFGSPAPDNRTAPTEFYTPRVNIYYYPATTAQRKGAPRTAPGLTKTQKGGGQRFRCRTLYNVNKTNRRRQNTKKRRSDSTNDCLFSSVTINITNIMNSSKCLPCVCEMDPVFNSLWMNK